MDAEITRALAFELVLKQQNFRKRRLSVPDVPKTDQTITFAQPPNRTFGDAPFQLSATASSNLPVVFSSSNTNIVSIVGTTATIVGAGTVTITAIQSGNSEFNAAPSVARVITIARAAQTITFNIGSNENKTLGDPPFTLSATSSSNLPVSFVSNNPTILSINDNIATVNSVGTVIITASQAGNANFLPAVDVTQQVTIVDNPNVAPSNTTPPVVTIQSGTGYEGSVLQVSQGNWTGTPSPTFSYEWLRNGTPITGATSASYTVAFADEGEVITCRVTATNAAGTAQVITSNNVHLWTPLDLGATLDLWIDCRVLQDGTLQAFTSRGGNKLVSPASTDPTGETVTRQGGIIFQYNINHKGLLVPALEGKRSFACLLRPNLPQAGEYLGIINTAANATGSALYLQRDGRATVFNGTNEFIATIAIANNQNGIIVTDGTQSGTFWVNSINAGTYASQAGFDIAANPGVVGGTTSEEFSGSLFHVISLTQNMSTDTRQRIEGFFAHTLNSQINSLQILPSDHPYKTTPPQG